MKKQNKAFKLFSVLVAAFLLFSSCNIGLGSAIDLEAPKVELFSHRSNDYVATNFTLRGIVKDNEAIARLTIDFDEADIHYRLEENGKWLKKTSTQDWQEVEDGKASISRTNTLWNWSIDVSANDSKPGTGSTYNFTIIAYDKVGNTASQSKLDCSLVVDEQIPSVSINRPELDLTYEIISSNSDNYNLNDGNVINRLLNGTISLEGRQDAASSFKELRIEFDNGTTVETVNSSTNTLDLSELSTEAISNAHDFDRSKVYYSKTLEVGKDNVTDLRTWNIFVPQEDWVTDSKNSELKTGKHIIRVVSTSISNSNAWERKVLGYFVWWPEADKPWMTMYTGSDTLDDIERSSVYPSSVIYGLSQDDDGIKTIQYKIEKINEDEENEVKSSGNLNLSDENAKSSSWALNVPAEFGNYKFTIRTTDIYGSYVEAIKYYQVLDIQPPKINLESPTEGSSAITKNQTISFKGTIVDDGVVSNCKITYLKDTSPESKIKYLNGSSEAWNNSTDEEFGNKIFTLDLGEGTFDEINKTITYNFSKNFNIFDDLEIGSDNNLTTQEFVIWVKDVAGLATVQLVSLLGDTENPKISIDSIQLFDSNHNQKTEEIEFGNDVPNLPVINEGNYVLLNGTWSDNSTNTWQDFSKIENISLEWGNVEQTLTQKEDGTWSVKLIQDAEKSIASGVIAAKLKDFGGNETIVTKPIFVEKEDAKLDRINSENVDGSYKAGNEIVITLDFTKNVNHTGDDPTLTLNTNGVAEYVSGAGSSKYKFAYTVKDGDNVEKLDVTQLNFNGEWYDVKTNTTFEVKIEDADSSLDSRNIKLDTTPPTIKSITVNSEEGYYGVGSTIYLKLEFSEDVTVENPENLKLCFNLDDGTVYSLASSTGSKNMLLPYVVGEGQNTSKLTLKSLSRENVTVTDAAGNSLTDWGIDTNLGKNIIIDTTAPTSPGIVLNNFKDGDYLTSFSVNPSFTLSKIEEGATVEYSTNGGTIWKEYNEDEEVVIPANGTYTIVARQTDKAGNVSEKTTPISFTIDRGSLISRISASTPSGTYSTNTSTNKIEGYIQFRKEVTVEKSAEVTLNIKNGTSTEATVSLNECEEAASKGYKFTFTYEIKEGDYIENNSVLDLTKISFDSVMIGENEIPVLLDEVASTDKFSTNRQIKILTGNPTVADLAITGEDENAVFTVSFDREITKGDGTITITQSEDDYRVPTVLTVSEYNELKAVIGDDLDNYYTSGLNGATLNLDNTLTPDTATKYILDFSYDNNNTDLVNLFRNKGLHIVKIPIYASAVTVSGKTLTAKLTGAYKLPVKGASYTIELSENSVKDSVSNPNLIYSIEKTSPGVEKPEIRIQKNGYEIVNAGDLLNSDVDMPETAQMKISCQTPGSSIKYGLSESSSTHVVINDCDYHETKTEDVTIPTINNDYTGTITLGDSGLTFDTAKGMKFAIAAQAISSEATSEVAYEYAARTVLKFYIGNRYKNADNQGTTLNEDNHGNFLTPIKDSKGNNSNVSKLTIWIIGGDSDSGGNTIDPFPLSWGDPSNFKMMKLQGGNKDKTTVRGEWYWVTWDISAPTYHGFVAGDVPSDAQENGPSIWYAGECFYTPLKSYYILHPGETLYMTMRDGFTDSETNKWVGYDEDGRAAYFFRWKNIGTR